MAYRYLGAVRWLALALLAVYLAHLWIAFGSSTFLYLYGATWCPHCRDLDAFLSKRYTDSYLFCKIDLSEECRRAFDSLRGVLGTRVPPEYREYLGSIPQTYVVRDGKYIVAIVVGAVTDERFWRNVTAMEPRERVLLVVPPNVYEIPMSFSEQSDLVSKYILVNGASTRPSRGWELGPQILVPAALVAAGGALVAYAFIRGRK